MEIRKVRFQQSGGFAGLVRGCDVEAASLDASALRALEQQAEAGSRGASRSPAARDTLTYAITIETEAGTKTLEFDELNVPAGLASLVAHLSKQCRPVKP
jgi:hypothetical protein